MNLTPLKLNDDSRLQQARKERETAAYLRKKADDAERMAGILEAHASAEGVADDAKVLELPEADLPAIFRQPKTAIMNGQTEVAN